LENTMNAPLRTNLTAESIRIESVTPEQMQTAARVTAADGLSGFEDDAGIITRDQVQIHYDYSPDRRTLTLQPLRVSGHLGSLPGATLTAVLRQYVQDALSGGGSWPSHPGVYNYVVPTIVNQSGSRLTFSTSSINPGTVTVLAQSIARGETKQAFEADSIVLAWDGTGGTVLYSFADGVTTLNISWYLNTVLTHSFTPGVSGGNADRYTVTVQNADPVLAGYTYLMPTVTIDKS
jgi:hypothetical protein